MKMRVATQWRGSIDRERQDQIEDARDKEVGYGGGRGEVAQGGQPLLLYDKGLCGFLTHAIGTLL